MSTTIIAAARVLAAAVFLAVDQVLVALLLGCPRQGHPRFCVRLSRSSAVPS
jgi:hypothetical protein